jgi:putative restriction endonuclease
MCGLVEPYCKRFSELQIEIHEHDWPGQTRHLFPGKPFLLIAVIDMIARGEIIRNFIEPTYNLEQAWLELFALLPKKREPASMSATFLQLDNEEFWHLLPRVTKGFPGCQETPSRFVLKQEYFGAKFSDELFPLLQMQASRDILRNSILRAHFSQGFARLLKNPDNQK